MALSTWISSVTNSTLNVTPSTFSFQDALSPFGAYASNFDEAPFLFRDGCSNCTASCQDESEVFGGLDTLHNCMVYPTVADLYARNNLSDRTLPATYNIQKAKVNSTLYINITTTIRTCLVDMCKDTPGCTEYLDQPNEQGTWSSSNMMWYSPLNLTSTFYLYSDTYRDYVSDVFPLCEYVPQSFNPDIGGIGVRRLSAGRNETRLLTFA